MALQSLERSENLVNPNAKRNHEQRDKDRDFIKHQLLEDNDVSAIEIHKRLHEHIKGRGDDYYLSITYVTNEVRRARNEFRELTRDNIVQHYHDALDIIKDNINLCKEELQKRFTERQDETIEIEDLNVTDFKSLTIEQVYIVNQLKEKLHRRTVRIRKIRPGQDFRDPMEMLLKWVERFSALTGIDAPKKIAKKVEKEVRRVLDVQDLETKATEMGYNKDIVKKLVESIKELGNDKK